VSQPRNIPEPKRHAGDQSEALRLLVVIPCLDEAPTVGRVVAIARNVGVLLHIDGDGQFDPADIPSLVKPVIDHEAHMVTASRFLDHNFVPTMPAVKR
jgi:hypothetical protein